MSSAAERERAALLGYATPVGRHVNNNTGDATVISALSAGTMELGEPGAGLLCFSSGPVMKGAPQGPRGWTQRSKRPGIRAVFNYGLMEPALSASQGALGPTWLTLGSPCSQTRPYLSPSHRTDHSSLVSDYFSTYRKSVGVGGLWRELKGTRTFLILIKIERSAREHGPWGQDRAENRKISHFMSPRAETQMNDQRNVK